MRSITIARPQNLDLAVPVLRPDGSSGQNIRQIMEGYSRFQPNWIYAANVEYRQGPNGPAMGILAERGTVYRKTHLNWPVFYVDAEGKARVAVNGHQAPLQTARLAFSAGPVLIRNGRLTNITDELARTEGLDASIRPGQVLPRAAIGVRQSDGHVIHLADTGATLDEVASSLRLLGCSEVLALDGGGSVGLINRKGEIVLGYAERQVCSALVFRSVEEHYLEDTAPAPPAVSEGAWTLVVPGLTVGAMYFAAHCPDGFASKNFKWSEFACKGTKRLFIARYLVDMCQFVRDRLGGPLGVTSAYRAPSHNVEQPGADMNSYHTMGLAVDLRNDSWGADRLITLAREFGWKGGLGRYATFTHFDLGPIRTWRG